MNFLFTFELSGCHWIQMLIDWYGAKTRYFSHNAHTKHCLPGKLVQTPSIIVWCWRREKKTEEKKCLIWNETYTNSWVNHFNKHVLTSVFSPSTIFILWARWGECWARWIGYTIVWILIYIQTSAGDSLFERCVLLYQNASNKIYFCSRFRARFFHVFYVNISAVRGSLQTERRQIRTYGLCDKWGIRQLIITASWTCRI